MAPSQPTKLSPAWLYPNVYVGHSRTPYDLPCLASNSAIRRGAFGFGFQVNHRGEFNQVWNMVLRFQRRISKHVFTSKEIGHLPSQDWSVSTEEVISSVLSSEGLRCEDNGKEDWEFRGMPRGSPLSRSWGALRNSNAHFAKRIGDWPLPTTISITFSSRATCSLEDVWLFRI